MKIKINNKELNAPDNFKYKYKELYKYIQDPLHIAIYCVNGKCNDLIFIISPQNNNFYKISFEDFSVIFRKLNIFLFFNISSLFDKFIIKDEINDIKIINKSILETLLKKDLEFKNTNIIIENNILYIYFATKNEISTTLKISDIKQKKHYIELLKKFNIVNYNNSFYSLFDEQLYFIDEFGYINSLSDYVCKQIGINPMKITNNIIKEKFKNIYKCDIRKGFLNMNDDNKNKQCKHFNTVVKDNVLYAFFIDTTNQNYSTYRECSSYTYNNLKKDKNQLLCKNFNTNEIFYCINGLLTDFIFFKSNLNHTPIYISIDKLNFKNFSEVMQVFDTNNIIYINNKIYSLRYDETLNPKSFVVKNGILYFN